MATEHIHEDHHATAAFMTNHIVANLGVLNIKLHQYHWHIQGPHFFTLHAKFEELYNEVNQYFDAFAERLIALGQNPYSTLEEFLEHTFIHEKTYDKKIAADKMVENLVTDYRTIQDVAIKAIELAGKEEDAVTEDLLIDYKDSIDSTIWMLQAYLGKDAQDGEEE
ncbi:DNA starvation/stationary phase protection protein [Virgibacillus sp. NKC19-16]|uniref:Dps family protein n=1 Tax=Virgibacillus salidurans TaxID=2831673 RepID=UPI001F327B93|nr:DNA starvation/stationary phase protection protein [Virgibacillus sp. NKC19-16]UJL46694.1 DNA starvation/stationary phase protection protein [Virgibacillus sp. NKC19-16]